MIDYLKIEASDFDAIKAFYRAALTALGLKVTRELASGPAKHRSLGFSGESLEFYFVEERRRALQSFLRFAWPRFRLENLET